MNQISPLTSKFRPENFFSRADHLKQLKLPKSSSHLIIIPSNSEGLGFLLNCYNDKVLSQKLDKNLFQSTILNANRICESVWKKKRMLEENDELYWLDYLMVLTFALLFLGFLFIIEYTEDLENGFLYAALVFFVLGGALAVHAGVDIVRNFGPVDEFYTFGQPRVGNQEFASYVNVLVPGSFNSRVTHNKDPVPHLPLLAMGFFHIDREVFYDSDGGYKVCVGGEDSSCSNYQLNVNILDHLNYMGVELLPYMIACNPLF